MSYRHAIATVGFACFTWLEQSIRQHCRERGRRLYDSWTLDDILRREG